MHEGRPVIGNQWLLALVIVVLLLVAAHAAMDIRALLSSPPPVAAARTRMPPTRTLPPIDPPPGLVSPEQTIDLALRPEALPTDFDPAINVVDPARLAPRLLDDAEEIARYLNAFQASEYAIFDVPGLGKFHLDATPDYIKDQLRHGRRWEPRIAELLGKFGRGGTTLIDAGAHIGAHTLTLSRIAGPQGRVYAFEPQKKIFRELHHNLRLNGVTNVVPLRFAVGDAPGVIEMDPSEKGNEGGTAVGAGGDKAELRTIDSFGFRNVSLMKIDVEGLEDPVLRGAIRTITESRPTLVVEIQGGYNFDDATSDVRKKIVDTIQRIEKLDYHVLRVSMYDYLALPLKRATQDD